MRRMQELTAVLLGNTLAVMLYDRITSLLLCGGVQLALLILTGGLWTHSIAGRNLMQRAAAPRLRPAASTA